MGKKCRFPRPPSGGFGKPHAPFADNDFSALPSRRLDRRARHNPTARHPVDERSHGAQRPTLSPRFARERKTKLPPAPNGDARLANDAAIGSRTSGRRSTPRFLAVKRRPARRDERPRAFVRAPRRRSVATPPRAPCSAGLATRGRPRARPIGRSVQRPLTSRLRRSARSRSEADWREPARLTRVGATKRRCPVGIRRRRDLARRLRIRQGVQAGFGPPALLPRLGGARRRHRVAARGRRGKVRGARAGAGSRPATATARPTRWTSPRSPRRTARRTFSRGTCRGPSRARSAGAPRRTPTAAHRRRARKHDGGARRRRRIFRERLPYT